MKVVKVIYKKNFVIGKNLYEHFTYEAELEENDTPEECFTKLKDMANAQHLSHGSLPMTTAEIIQRDNDEWDKEYPIFKQSLIDTPDREDASRLLMSSIYYDVLELKMIVKNKPSKYE